MCRMVGIKNFNFQIHKDIVEAFFDLSLHGRVLRGDSRGHTDGWGIGYYKNAKAFVYKSGRSIREEKNLFFEKIKSIETSPVVILHIRKSSWKNTNSVENSHPFIKENIIFAHNGTIYDYRKIKQEFTTSLDSEVYFNYIMSFYKGNLIKALKTASSKIKKLKHSSMTCLLSDGTFLYALREYLNSPQYYALYKTDFSNSQIISSEPLGKNLQWRLLRKNEVVKV